MIPLNLLLFIWVSGIQRARTAFHLSCSGHSDLLQVLGRSLNKQCWSFSVVTKASFQPGLLCWKGVGQWSEIRAWGGEEGSWFGKDPCISILWTSKIRVCFLLEKRRILCTYDPLMCENYLWSGSGSLILVNPLLWQKLMRFRTWARGSLWLN